MTRVVRLKEVATVDVFCWNKKPQQIDNVFSQYVILHSLNTSTPRSLL